MRHRSVVTVKHDRGQHSEITAETYWWYSESVEGFCIHENRHEQRGITTQWNGVYILKCIKWLNVFGKLKHTSSVHDIPTCKANAERIEHG